MEHSSSQDQLLVFHARLPNSSSSTVICRKPKPDKSTGSHMSKCIMIQGFKEEVYHLSHDVFTIC